MSRMFCCSRNTRRVLHYLNIDTETAPSRNRCAQPVVFSALPRVTRTCAAGKGNEVLSVIRDLVREEGMTTLISTHEMGFAREFADRIVFDNSDIMRIRTASQIFAPPANQRIKTLLTSVLNKDKRERVRLSWLCPFPMVCRPPDGR